MRRERTTSALCSPFINTLIGILCSSKALLNRIVTRSLLISFFSFFRSGLQRQALCEISHGNLIPVARGDTSVALHLLQNFLLLPPAVVARLLQAFEHRALGVDVRH